MNVFGKIKFLFKARKNVAALTLLSITIATCQFCVYSIINLRLGREMLGVWSLVVAATSIGQISNFGFSSSIVRYFPEMLGKRQNAEIQKMMGTINLSNFIITLPMLIIMYFPAVYYGKILLDQHQFTIFHSVLIFSMSSLFVNSLFLVYSYTLDAMEKHHIRSRVQIAGWIIFLIISIFLLPVIGIKGVAIAMLIQNIFQFATIVFIVYKKGLFRSVYPLAFDRPSFKKVFSFGTKSQAISILTIFFDPLIKYFITKNTGLAGVGNYELANKIVVQIKNLLVNASQVIIPKMVKHRVNRLENKYFSQITSNNTILAISAAMMNLLIAPLAVYFFAGHFDRFLIQCIILINIGWAMNMMTIPHYFSSIGLDKIGRLIFYHLILSVLVLAGYLVIQGRQQSELIYFIIPPLALLGGSLYNSYLLRNVVKSAFRWLSSGFLIYFILVSVTLIFLLQYSLLMAFVTLGIFLLLFCWRVIFTIKNRSWENYAIEHE